MAREQPYEELTDEQVIENVSFIYHNEARKVRNDGRRRGTKGEEVKGNGAGGEAGRRRRGER